MFLRLKKNSPALDGMAMSKYKDSPYRISPSRMLIPF